MFPIVEETDEFIDAEQKYQWAIINDKYRVIYCNQDNSVQLQSFLKSINVHLKDPDVFNNPFLTLILPYIHDPPEGSKLMEIRDDGLYVHISFLIYIGIYTSPKFCAERIEQCNEFFANWLLKQNSKTIKQGNGT